VQNENDVVLNGEAAEVEAWKDMYSAMPETFRDAFGAEIFDVDGVTLTRCRKIPLSHFNAVLDFGLSGAATAAQLERTERNMRAYETWQALGFAWPYVRFLYGRT
jgi:hypothetical protein